jgi:cysteinyl-tRNA synthetase
MSKSLGNFFTVRDLLDQGWPGEVIRFVYLGTHYSKPMDWTVEKAVGVQSKLSDYVMIVDRYGDLAIAKQMVPPAEIVEALADDLNTHAALMVLDRLANFSDGTGLARGLDFLGILSLEAITEKVLGRRRAVDSLSSHAERLQRLRVEAKESKDFSMVDRVKRVLGDAGVIVQMNANEVTLEPGPNFDPTALETLL